jgi:hypothetical protein
VWLKQVKKLAVGFEVVHGVTSAIHGHHALEREISYFNLWVVLPVLRFIFTAATWIDANVVRPVPVGLEF